LRFYTYRERDIETIHKALNWGINKLLLGGWSLSLYIGDAARDIETLSSVLDVCGGVAYRYSVHHADISLQLDQCEEKNMDPVWALLHELVHVRCYIEDLVSDSDELFSVWENHAMVFSDIIYQLWLREEENEEKDHPGNNAVKVYYKENKEEEDD
jgi:hypothetical protein